MADDIIIKFDGVWKKFRKGERHDSLRDLIPSAIRRFTSPRSTVELQEQEFWALRDVSFEVARGRALGIIGHNGAGKSTTLKLLTKILRPTLGHCDVRGRTGALIEVAAGFHPDLTGRENIFLQGAIMGMRRDQIAARIDEIIEFAEVSAFIDTPVKRYSSGMNARLGFAIAAHLDPDALIIDEVLSVGDMAFQEKCVERMKQFKRDGVAIAFVSHNLPAVSSLCESSVVLSAGTPVFAGSTADCIEYYVEHGGRGAKKGGTGAIDITSMRLLGQDGKPIRHVVPGDELIFEIEFAVCKALSGVSYGFIVYDAATGAYVAAANSGSLGVRPEELQSGQVKRLSLNFTAHLANGQYLFEFHVATAATGTYHAVAFPAASFRVEEKVSPFGVAFLDFRLTDSM